jgi:hypothetical protein
LRGREAFRAQSAILDEKQPQTPFGVIPNRVFGTDAFYPYQKHGWRARARKSSRGHATTFETPYVLSRVKTR